MNAQQHDPTRPFMTTIANRPAVVAQKLASTNDVYVQCRTGDIDCFVPLDEIFRLFVEEMRNAKGVIER